MYYDRHYFFLDYLCEIFSVFALGIAAKAQRAVAYSPTRRGAPLYLKSV